MARGARIPLPSSEKAVEKRVQLTKESTGKHHSNLQAACVVPKLTGESVHPAAVHTFTRMAYKVKGTREPSIKLPGAADVADVVPLTRNV